MRNDHSYTQNVTVMWKVGINSGIYLIRDQNHGHTVLQFHISSFVIRKEKTN